MTWGDLFKYTVVLESHPLINIQRSSYQNKKNDRLGEHCKESGSVVCVAAPTHGSTMRV